MNERNLYTQFDSVFFEKTRLSILTVLYREMNVSYNRLKKIIGGTDGAIYAHVKKLVRAGYVKQHKEIKSDRIQTVYSLTGSGINIFRRYLKFLEHVLTSDLSENGLLD